MINHAPFASRCRLQKYIPISSSKVSSARASVVTTTGRQIERREAFSAGALMRRRVGRAEIVVAAAVKIRTRAKTPQFSYCIGSVWPSREHSPLRPRGSCLGSRTRRPAAFDLDE
ncbi:hypothetical protein EVAR_94438_1 [Eumeta japonica]|uniref:Uncharacterized protein n=1 Tax=Eumeta variegata TaxID=151549 RepID=A0A4C1TQ51_EUMVA|nr:hypothetical protein EVAR_94438_1 [Eumeta japonica]